MSEEFNFKIKIAPYAIYGIFSGVIILTSFFLSLFIIPEGSFVILEGVIGNKYSLINLSFAALIVCGINLALSWEIYRKDRIASHVLGVLAIAVSAIILLKVAAVIFAL